MTSRYGVPVVRRPWTSSQDEIVAKLWYEGKSAGEIVKVLGCGTTRCSVLGRVHRKGFVRAGECKVSSMSRENRLRKRPREDETVVYPKETDPLAEAPVAIADLMSCHCRWPIGHPRDPGFLYCGNPKDVTESYCKGHAKIAYPHGAPMLRARAPTRQALYG